MAKSAKKRHQQRMLKEKRNDGKFWAEGGRETILLRWVPQYTAGLQKGWVEERQVLRLVRREYDYHVDWRLKDTEEPPQPFRLWTPSTEREPLDLTPEEAVLHAAYSEFMTKRIRRWLNYRARRLMKKYSLARGANQDDPFLVLLAKLTGIHKPKKALQAYQQWSSVHYEGTIKSVVVEEWEAHKLAQGITPTKGLTGGFRAKVTMRMFLALPKDEQLKWKKEAIAVSEAQRKEYEAALKRPYATDPASRQKAIKNFSKFITPILEGCAEILGFKVLLMVGGPMPRLGGELGTVTVPVGKNLDAIPSTFTDYKPEQFAAIKEVYKAYLRTAYTDEDIKASALPEDVDNDDLQDLLPFDEAIRAIHDDADLSSDDSDDSSSDDSSDDEAPPVKGKKRGHRKESQREPPQKRGGSGLGKDNDDSSDDEAPPVTGKKRGRKKESEREPSQKRGGSGNPSKRGNKKAKVSEQEGQAVGIDDAVGTSTLSSTEVVGPAPLLPSTVYDPLPLPFDITDPAILNPVPSTEFSFSELHAPLVDGAVPDYMDPASWRMEDWMFDPSFEQFDTTAMDSSGTTGMMDFNAVPDLATSTFPSQPFPSSAATLPAAAAVPTSSPSSVQTANSTILAPLASAASNALPSTIVPTLVEDGHEIDVSSAPTWFQGLWEYLKNEELGAKFTSVMGEWYKLEKTYEFANHRVGYATKGRPDILSSWIKCGRVRVANPSITSLAKFKEQFWRWWHLQQPEWRNVEIRVTPDGESWESAKFPGINGMCSFVALLRWWGDAAKDEVDEMEEWKKAVDDVAWVMESLRSEYSV